MTRLNWLHLETRSFLRIPLASVVLCCSSARSSRQCTAYRISYDSYCAGGEVEAEIVQDK